MPREFEVARICGKRSGPAGKREFLVDWKGYAEQTWEPEKNLCNSQDLLEAYLQQLSPDKMPKETTSLRSRNVARGSETSGPSSGRSRSAGRKPTGAQAVWQRDKNPPQPQRAATRSRSRSRGRPKKEAKTEPLRTSTRQTQSKEKGEEKKSPRDLTPKGVSNGEITATQFYGRKPLPVNESSLLFRMSKADFVHKPNGSAPTVRVSPNGKSTLPESAAADLVDGPTKAPVEDVKKIFSQPQSNWSWRFASIVVLIICLLIVAAAIFFEDQREQLIQIIGDLKKKTAEIFPSL